MNLLNFLFLGLDLSHNLLYDRAHLVLRVFYRSAPFIFLMNESINKDRKVHINLTATNE